MHDRSPHCPTPQQPQEAPTLLHSSRMSSTMSVYSSSFCSSSTVTASFSDRMRETMDATGSGMPGLGALCCSTCREHCEYQSEARKPKPDQLQVRFLALLLVCNCHQCVPFCRAL